MPDALTAQVARWARESPDAPAYVFVDYLGHGARHTLTWRQADLRARALAVRLRELAGPGDRAAIMAPQGLDYVVAVLGALYAGIVAVPLFTPDLPGHAERLSCAYADADPALVLTTSSALPAVREFLPSEPKAVLVLDTVPDLLADEWEGHQAGPGAIVAMPVVGGNHAVFMDPVAFVMRPVRWLQLLAEHADAYTGAPNFAFEYTAARVSDADQAGLDLSGVQVMLNGAEPVRPGTIEAFDAAFAGCGLRPEAHTPAYGLAEATVFVAATERDARPLVTDFDRDALRAGRAVPYTIGARSTLVSCGRPTGQTVQILSEYGEPRPDGEVGEICVRGPNVASAYWRDPARTAEVFAGGLLRTGDLGVIHDGQLYVTGRIKDLVIVDGRNHYPQDIEVTVQEAHPAVRRDRVAAFAVPGESAERLVVLAYLEGAFV